MNQRKRSPEDWMDVCFVIFLSALMICMGAIFIYLSTQPVEMVVINEVGWMPSEKTFFKRTAEFVVGVALIMATPWAKSAYKHIWDFRGES